MFLELVFLSGFAFGEDKEERGNEIIFISTGSRSFPILFAISLSLTSV
jgi:hypothetical protein